MAVTPFQPIVEALLPIDPSTLSPTAWYRSDSLEALADGALLAQWDDESGNGRHLTAPSAGVKPSVAKGILGKRSAVRFDGAANPMYFTTVGPPAFTLGDLITASAGTVIAVTRGDSDAVAGSRIFHAGTLADLANGQSVRLVYTGVTNLRAANRSGSAQQIIGTLTPVSVDNWFITQWRHGSSLQYMAADDLDDDGMNSISSGDTDSAVLGWRVGVGAVADGTSLLKGHIAELIFFATDLTQAQRRGVALYLARKYSLVYASTMPTDWTTLSVLADPGVTAERGIHGTSFTDRVASTGTMSFDLDNSSRQYSPDSLADWLVGFDVGLDVRLRVVFDNLNQVIWRGRIDEVTPTTGKIGRRVTVHAVDWMDEAAKAKLSVQAVVTDKRSDEIFVILAAAVNTQPTATTYTQGADTYPYAFDSARDEDISVMSEFQRVCMSEIGFVYLKGDGTLVFEGRRKRGTRSVAIATLADDRSTGLELSRARSAILNNIKVESHPRRKDTSNQVLFTLEQAPAIPRMTSATFVCTYRDPSQKSTRVGGVSMVAPVVTTDYLFNELADGTGVVRTTQLTVTATFGGNSASVVVTNNGPQDGFLTLLQLRGLGLYDFETVLSTSRDTASVARYGEWAYSVSMPYQADAVVAAEAAAYIAANNKDPQTRISSAEMKAVSSSTKKFLIKREISDRITVTETQSGVSADYFVNGISYEFTGHSLPRVTYTLAPADTTGYWTLQVAGLSELDRTTRLGYGIFVAKWVLDLSTVSVDTIVNV
jgi:hypothetical protein